MCSCMLHRPQKTVRVPDKPPTQGEWGGNLRCETGRAGEVACRPKEATLEGLGSIPLLQWDRSAAKGHETSGWSHPAQTKGISTDAGVRGHVPLLLHHDTLAA